VNDRSRGEGKRRGKAQDAENQDMMEFEKRGNRKDLTNGLLKGMTAYYGSGLKKKKTRTSDNKKKGLCINLK